MAAFGWAETCHRDARRKSAFHAAVASCDIISLASSAGHACTYDADAGRPLRYTVSQAGIRTVKDEDAVLLIKGGG